MGTKFIVYTPRQDVTAHLMPRDNGNWEQAARRAIKRVYGPYAEVWSWQYESREETSHGRVVAMNYKATITGKKEKHGNSWPILGEARIRLDYNPH